MDCKTPDFILVRPVNATSILMKREKEDQADSASLRRWARNLCPVLSKMK
jgi:hypothetical protein